MGLREQKKTKRLQRILDAATTLFVWEGFDDVKAEDIAEMAEVSVGTLYNYFGGKNEILMTLVAIENEALEELGKDFAPDPKASATESITALMNLFFDPKNMKLRRDLWRLGFALSFYDVTSEEARRLRASDRVLTRQVIDLAHRLQSAGKLREDVDCDAFGATLFNNANMMFFEYTRSENLTYEEVNAEIIRMTQAIVNLAQPIDHSTA